MSRTLTGGKTVTDFECSVNAVRATANFLMGKDHGGMSTQPSSKTLAKLLELPPARARAEMFRLAAWSQGLPLSRAPEIDVDSIDRWVVDQYAGAGDGRGGLPGAATAAESTYPAVLIGAPNGAAFHLSAALGVPFLPQTTLVSVKDVETHVDDPTEAMHALAPTVQQVARRNPRTAVYHMHDPAQDRPMMQQLAFMRLKRLELGPIYEQFLRENLAPGGTIIQLENTRTWGSTSTGGSEPGERSYFQFGCLGGVPEEEFFNPGERIREFLAHENSSYTRWDPPEPDARRPDGEWGWDPALGESVGQLAADEGFERRRLVVNEPQDASGFIAELHRDWYRRLGRGDQRLLVQTYAHVDPLWTLKTGSVPFWNRFHMEPSYQVVAQYLRDAEPYDHIHIALFAHGVESPALVAAEDWESLAQHHGRISGEAMSVNKENYPLDPGAPIRYQKTLEEIPERQPLPRRLTVEEIDEFAASAEALHGPVQWLDGAVEELR